LGVSEKVEDHAMLRGFLRTGHIRTSKGSEPNPRSMRNFPVQGGCADLLHVAANLAAKRGIPICAPVHDAFLICAPLDRIGTQEHFGPDVLAMQECMAEASRKVLGGFELFSDAKIFRYPDRYFDKRGVVMWDTVNDILEAKYDRKIG
jgi:DNA polymerase-1